VKKYSNILYGSKAPYGTLRKAASDIKQFRNYLTAAFAFANEVRPAGIASRQYLGEQFKDFLQVSGISQVQLRLLDGKSGLTVKLRDHLRRRFNQIIENADQIAEIPLFKIKVVVEFNVDPISNEFNAVNSFRAKKTANDAKSFREALDWGLIELIRELQLKPKRFGRCQRCGAFFYQHTTRIKKFCSSRCAGTVRQARYVMRKSGRRKS